MHDIVLFKGCKNGCIFNYIAMQVISFTNLIGLSLFFVVGWGWACGIPSLNHYEPSALYSVAATPSGLLSSVACPSADH